MFEDEYDCLNAHFEYLPPFYNFVSEYLSELRVN